MKTITKFYKIFKKAKTFNFKLKNYIKLVKIKKYY